METDVLVSPFHFQYTHVLPQGSTGEDAKKLTSWLHAQKIHAFYGTRKRPDKVTIFMLKPITDSQRPENFRVQYRDTELTFTPTALNERPVPIFRVTEILDDLILKPVGYAFCDLTPDQMRSGMRYWPTSPLDSSFTYKP